MCDQQAMRGQKRGRCYGTQYGNILLIRPHDSPGLLRLRLQTAVRTTLPQCAVATATHPVAVVFDLGGWDIDSKTFGCAGVRELPATMPREVKRSRLARCAEDT